MVFGYITEGKRAQWQEKELCGVLFYEVTLPVSHLFCRVHRRLLWKKLRRCGVRRCIMEQKWEAEAAQYGISPVEAAPLRRTLLPRLLPELTGQTVALRAQCADGDVVQAAELLARRARYVSLDVPRGGDILARQLRNKYGLSTLSGVPAAVTVDFTDTCRGALSLGEGGTMLCRAGGQILPEKVVAALFYAGTVKKEEIEIYSIPFNP